MSVSSLEFDGVASPDDFYSHLKAQVSLPKSFGRNLDALFDYLTTDLSGPVAIVWRSYAADVAAHPELRTVRAVLLSAGGERDDLSIDWG